jgi:hypothetical protein
MISRGKLEVLCFQRVECSFPVSRCLRNRKLGNDATTGKAMLFSRVLRDASYTGLSYSDPAPFSKAHF